MYLLPVPRVGERTQISIVSVLQPEERIQQAWLSGMAIQSQEGIGLFVPNSALLKCATGRGL